MMYHLWSWPVRFMSRTPAKKIRKILSGIIARRFEEASRTGGVERHDILSGLMQAVDPVCGDKFDYQETVDQVCMLFLAGHETSASALAWSLYLLSHRPDIQDRMRREIQEFTMNGELTFSAIRKFRLTSNVFREALRLYPPVGFFAREASRNSLMRDKKCPRWFAGAHLAVVDSAASGTMGAARRVRSRSLRRGSWQGIQQVRLYSIQRRASCLRWEGFCHPRSGIDFVLNRESLHNSTRAKS